MNGQNGPIQQIPRGLLDLFQLKNLGRNPSLLTESYYPCLEIRDWLMFSKRERLFTSIAVATGTRGFQNFPTPIPSPDPGEVWYVHSAFAAFNDITAPDVVHMQIAHRQETGTGVRLVGRRNQPCRPPGLAAGVLSQPACSDGEFWLQGPGDVGVWLETTVFAAGPITLRLMVEFTRLKV